MSICENAMVLNLQIGLWTGHRLDKDATRRVVDDANAEDDAARVNKHLIPKSAMKDIVSAAGAVRTHLYEKTLPWKDNGDRLLTRALYMDFIAEHSQLVDEFRFSVDRFLRAGYPEAVEQASFRMGTLFKADDYPTPAALRSKFYVNLDIDAVTTAGDFRVAMDEEQIDNIRQDMEEALQKRLNTAMADVWERIAKAVGRFHERTSNKDGRFHSTVVDNLRELVDILPGLNVLNDPDIASIGDQIKRDLYGYDSDDIRKDEEVRFEAAEAAKAIMSKMEGYMRAFGN